MNKLSLEDIKNTATGRVLERVVEERRKQDRKWGEQNHDATVWITVLMEEVGELSEQILEFRASNIKYEMQGHEIEGYTIAIEEEAIQVAAVAVAFIEWLERGMPVNQEEHLKGAGLF